MSKEKLYIVMPTYNEELNIEQVVKEWYSVLDGKDKESKIVIADGGSTDKTLELLYALQKVYPQLEVISRPGTDHGTKVIFLYNYAIDQNADWIFQTDSDGQTRPDEFSKFWELRKEYDAIIGNRTNRMDGKSRELVEKVLCFLLLLFFGTKIPDANAPFRLMKTDVVAKYLGNLPKDFNLPNALLVMYFTYFHEKMKYINVTFQPRQGGKNHMNYKLIFKIGWQSLSNFYKLKKELKKLSKET